MDDLGGCIESLGHATSRERDQETQDIENDIHNIQRFLLLVKEGDKALDLTVADSSRHVITAALGTSMDSADRHPGQGQGQTNQNAIVIGGAAAVDSRGTAGIAEDRKTLDNNGTDGAAANRFEYHQGMKSLDRQDANVASAKRLETSVTYNYAEYHQGLTAVDSNSATAMVGNSLEKSVAWNSAGFHQGRTAIDSNGTAGAARNRLDTSVAWNYAAYDQGLRAVNSVKDNNGTGGCRLETAANGHGFGHYQSQTHVGSKSSTGAPLDNNGTVGIARNSPGEASVFGDGVGYLQGLGALGSNGNNGIDGGSLGLYVYDQGRYDLDSKACHCYGSSLETSAYRQGRGDLDSNRTTGIAGSSLQASVYGQGRYDLSSTGTAERAGSGLGKSVYGHGLSSLGSVSVDTATAAANSLGTPVVWDRAYYHHSWPPALNNASGNTGRGGDLQTAMHRLDGFGGYYHCPAPVDVTGSNLGTKARTEEEEEMPEVAYSDIPDITFLEDLDDDSVDDAGNDSRTLVTEEGQREKKNLTTSVATPFLDTQKDDDDDDDGGDYYYEEEEKGEQNEEEEEEEEDEEDEEEEEEEKGDEEDYDSTISDKTLGDEQEDDASHSRDMRGIADLQGEDPAISVNTTFTEDQREEDEVTTAVNKQDQNGDHRNNSATSWNVFVNSGQLGKGAYRGTLMNQEHDARNITSFAPIRPFIRGSTEQSYQDGDHTCRKAGDSALVLLQRSSSDQGGHQEENATSNNSQAAIQPRVFIQCPIEQGCQETPRPVIIQGYSYAGYVCHVCQKTLTRPETLKEHMLIHSGETPYHCHLCNKAFRSKIYLSRHMALHKHPYRYLCLTCSKGFPRKSDLTRHQRSHTGEKPYGCPVCGQTFSDQSNCKRHVQRQHKPGSWLLLPVGDPSSDSR